MADYTTSTRFTHDDRNGVNELNLLKRIDSVIGVALPQYEDSEEYAKDVRTLHCALGKDWLRPDQMQGLERLCTRLMVQCQVESRFEHWAPDIQPEAVQPDAPRENNPAHMALVLMEARAQQYEMARDALGVVQRANRYVAG